MPLQLGPELLLPRPVFPPTSLTCSLAGLAAYTSCVSFEIVLVEQCPLPEYGLINVGLYVIAEHVQYCMLYMHQYCIVQHIRVKVRMRARARACVRACVRACDTHGCWQ